MQLYKNEIRFIETQSVQKRVGRRTLKGEFTIFFREFDVPQLGESSQMGRKTSTDFLGPFWLASNWGDIQFAKEKNRELSL